MKSHIQSFGLLPSVLGRPMIQRGLLLGTRLKSIFRYPCSIRVAEDTARSLSTEQWWNATSKLCLHLFQQSTHCDKYRWISHQPIPYRLDVKVKQHSAACALQNVQHANTTFFPHGFCRVTCWINFYTCIISNQLRNASVRCTQQLLSKLGFHRIAVSRSTCHSLFRYWPSGG